MNDPTLLAQALTALGLGAYLPVALALIGLASAIATVYPPSWPGAAMLHKLALLFGRAAPATPAGKGSAPGPGTAAVVGLLLAAAALGACSTAQEATACAIDAAVVPAADAALTAAGGPAAVAGAVDAASVHPAVQAACAALAAPAASPAAPAPAPSATPPG
jgi:hypothetical protein